jgi:hypothetical protein
LHKASFYQQFVLGYQADFNLEQILKNASILFRERKGVTIDECSRLCFKELTFQCESMSYEHVEKVCKWSSLNAQDIEDLVYQGISIITFNTGINFYLSNSYF